MNGFGRTFSSSFLIIIFMYLRSLSVSQLLFVREVYDNTNTAQRNCALGSNITTGNYLWQSANYLWQSAKSFP